MLIDSSTIVSVTEANQNFSRVTRIAGSKGEAIIFKNNRPKYRLIDLDNSPMVRVSLKDLAKPSGINGLQAASNVLLFKNREQRRSKQIERRFL